MELIEQILAHAARNPGHPAVVVGHQVQATYADLADLAGQVHARLTSSRPTEPDDPAPGLAVMTRSPAHLIAGLVGARAAGWWYLPVDAAQPVERAWHFIRDAGCRAVLADLDLGLYPETDPETVTPSRPAFIIDPGSLETGRAQRPTVLAQPRPQARQYVIYTSGSTGSPKGAAVSREAFDRLVHWYRDAVHLRANDRVLLASSPGFDLTQKNYWAPLSVGATLVFPEKFWIFDPRRIRDAADHWAPSVLNCAPTAFFTLAEWRTPWRSSLRTLVLGGERIDATRLRTWMQATGFAGDLLNGYGPTECTGIVGASAVTTDPGCLDQLYPVAGTDWYVVGADGHEAAPGEPGELWIGGSQVGPGYVSNPAANADRFVPCRHQSGRKAFRSGDLAVTGTGGAVRILRRIDTTDVKVGGVRIDLDEVRDALREVPGAGDSTVFVAAGPDGRRGLVAVLGPGAPTPSGLRLALRPKLPATHVPAQYVTLSELPRTLSGKTDWQAAVATAAAQLGVDAVGPEPAVMVPDRQVIKTF